VNGPAWPIGPVAQCRLISFDGSSAADCEVRRPDRYGAFRAGEGGPVIPRGAGLSYVAASFGDGATAIEMGAFDRILGFDPAERLVEVEAGVTLGDLYHFLLPRGCYLPVQPGYGAITIGGCIGADVHGKNPAQDGTFISQIESLTLFHPDHGMVELSATHEPQLFRATCGGFGLTGIVLTARLRVQTLPGMAAEIALHPVADVPAGAALLRGLPAGSGGAHTWHDFSRFDRGFGRGVARVFRFLPGEVAAAPALPPARLSPEWRGAWPIGLMNRWTLRAMNTVYALGQRADGVARPADIAAVLFPIHGNELYFRLFGRAGFHESQVILPPDRLPDYLDRLRDGARRLGIAITLASTKLFAGTGDLLRFDGTGVSLAINLPRSRNSLAFLADLDRCVIELGGRPNAIKDSRLGRAVLDATYPESDRFRTILRQWDSKRRFCSDLSRRLAL
jgi:decaprenylphospho-beta-D-ribofuranose 2-oxidase